MPLHGSNGVVPALRSKAAKAGTIGGNPISGKPAACDCVRGIPGVRRWAYRVITPSPK